VSAAFGLWLLSHIVEALRAPPGYATACCAGAPEIPIGLLSTSRASSSASSRTGAGSGDRAAGTRPQNTARFCFEKMIFSRPVEVLQPVYALDYPGQRLFGHSRGRAMTRPFFRRRGRGASPRQARSSPNHHLGRRLDRGGVIPLIIHRRPGAIRAVVRVVSGNPYDYAKGAGAWRAARLFGLDFQLRFAHPGDRAREPGCACARS